MYVCAVYLYYTWVHSIQRMHPGQPVHLVRAGPTAPRAPDPGLIQRTLSLPLPQLSARHRPELTAPPCNFFCFETQLRCFLFRPLRLTAASSLADSAVLPHRRAALSAGVEALPRVAAAECFPRAADSWCGASRSGASRGGGSAAARGDSAHCSSPHLLRSPVRARRGFAGMVSRALPSPSPRPSTTHALKINPPSTAPIPPHLDPQPHLRSQSRVLHPASTAPIPPHPDPPTTPVLTIMRIVPPFLLHFLSGGVPLR